MRPSRAYACLLFLLLGSFCFFYGPALVAFAYVKWEFRDSQEIWMVPKPIPVNALPQHVGTKVTYFAYEFETTSSDVKEEKKFDSMVVFNLSDCAGVLMMKPGFAGKLTGVAQTQATMTDRNIEDLFGVDVTHSSYAIRSKELNLTPADLHLFSSRREIAGNAVLLILKHVESQRFKNGLYSFNSGWMRGFQEGDLARDKGVLVEAFDDLDHQVTLVVGAKPGKSCFAQSDLNRIIFSLRPIPAN